MKNFLLKLFIFAEFIIVFGLGYAVLHMALSPIQSIILVFAMVFFLFQALGNVDKLNGYGQYNKSNNNHDDDSSDDNQNHSDVEEDNDDENDDDFFLMDDGLE